MKVPEKFVWHEGPKKHLEKLNQLLGCVKELHDDIRYQMYRHLCECCNQEEDCISDGIRQGTEECKKRRKAHDAGADAGEDDRDWCCNEQIACDNCGANLRQAGRRVVCDDCANILFQLKQACKFQFNDYFIREPEANNESA